MVFVWVAGCVASCRSAACWLVRVAVGAGVLASRGLGNQRQPPAGGWSPPRRADRCDTQALENARSGFCSQGVKRVPLRPADRLSAGWSSAHGGLISCSVRRLGDRHQTEFYGSGWVSRSQGPNSCPLTNRANALHRVCVLRRIEAPDGPLALAPWLMQAALPARYRRVCSRATGDRIRGQRAIRIVLSAHKKAPPERGLMGGELSVELAGLLGICG